MTRKKSQDPALTAAVPDALASKDPVGQAEPTDVISTQPVDSPPLEEQTRSPEAPARPEILKEPEPAGTPGTVPRAPLREPADRVAAGSLPADPLPPLREPPRTQTHNRSTGLVLAGAVAAGFVAGLLGSGLMAAGGASPFGSGSDRDIHDRLTAVEANLVAVGTLQASLDGLGRRVEIAQSAAGSATEQARAAVQAARAAEVSKPAVAQMPVPDPAIAAEVHNVGRAVGTLGDRLNALEGKVSELARPTEGPTMVDLASSVAGLQDKIGQSVQSLQAGRAESAVVSVALVARERLQSGLPLGSEIAALKGLGLDQALLTPLLVFADRSAPSAAVLAQNFMPLAKVILSEARPRTGQGLLDRLAAEVSALVKIRPVGQVQGDTPSAIVARIETALAQGRIGDALSASESLPEPARAATKAWAADARARLDAAQTLDSLVASSVIKIVEATRGTGVPSR